jgi:hypothetical protein
MSHAEGSRNHFMAAVVYTCDTGRSDNFYWKHKGAKGLPNTAALYPPSTRATLKRSASGFHYSVYLGCSTLSSVGPEETSTSLDLIQLNTAHNMYVIIPTSASCH